MDLYYEIYGNGQPVVLIHSGGADLRDWTYLAPRLAQHYKVVAFDGRGAGKSPTPPKNGTYVEDVRALMDELGMDQATIIGHSIGGQIATEFSLQYPEKVSRLILIAPSLTGFHHSMEFEVHSKQILQAAPNIDKMLDIALDAPTYQVVIHSPHKDLTIQMLRHHFQRMFQWPPDFCMNWAQPPAIERLGELEPKTLFMIGKKDLADNFRVAEYFQAAPKVRFIEIDDADHMLTLTHAEELYQEITTFMEEGI
ncbi:alpha/beta fold hydrolase [Neobacillus sp. Marseille-QA0830]